MYNVYMRLIRWHVTDTPWDQGDLICRDEQDDPSPWKWDEADEGFDGDLICLFADKSDAQEFRAEYAPHGSLLRIELEQTGDNLVWDGVDERRVLNNREGYEAVVERISAKAITEA